jgi:hypothetical protein
MHDQSQKSGVIGYPWPNGGMTLTTIQLSTVSKLLPVVQSFIHGYYPFWSPIWLSTTKILAYVPRTTTNAAVDQQLKGREQILNILKENLQELQNRMKMQADKHRTENKFEVDNWVYLCLQPYIQK